MTTVACVIDRSSPAASALPGAGVEVKPVRTKDLLDSAQAAT